MSDKVIRNYKYADEDMLTKALVMYNHLDKDLASFTAEFPSIDAAFALQFEADINLAKNAAPDLFLVNSKKVMTDDIKQAMKQGDLALRKLGIYARLTYFNDRVQQRVFGQNSWQAARSNRKKMFVALEFAHNLVTQAPYQADLAATGYVAANALELETIANLLGERKMPQNKAAKERVVNTEKRLRLFNKVWATMKSLSVAAELVYREEPERHKLFMLYPDAAKNITTLKVQVLKNGKPVAGAVVTLSYFKKERTTNKRGVAVFKALRMPAKLVGKANGLQFMAEKIKKGKENIVKVEVEEAV